MSIKERKEKEKRDLERKILKAAERLYADGGYEKLSMRNIAKTIDYSPATIYRFFKNKNHLLTTIANNTYSNLTRRFEKIKQKKSQSPFKTLEMLIREYIIFCLEIPDIYKLYVNLCSFEIKDNGLYEIIGENRYRIFHSWQFYIEKLIKSGNLKINNSMTAVVLIFNTSDGYIINKIKHPNLYSQSDEKEISRLIDMIFEGIKK